VHVQQAIGNEDTSCTQSLQQHADLEFGVGVFSGGQLEISTQAAPKASNSLWMWIWFNSLERVERIFVLHECRCYVFSLAKNQEPIKARVRV